MKSNISEWIQRSRLLKPKLFPSQYAQKEQRILTLYKLALNNRIIPAQPYVYESHHADIRQVQELNAIICDIHFWDISWLISASFYSHPLYDIERLTDLIIADSLLCHGNPLLALKYAHKFVGGPYVAIHESVGNNELLDLISSSAQFQMVFAMSHEISHYFCMYENNNLATYYKMRMGDAVDNHNTISDQINSIDLSPIHRYLDDIDIKPAQRIQSTSDSVQITLKLTLELSKIIDEYGHLVDMQGVTPNERNKYLFYACDNYIRGVKASRISKEDMVIEGTCDLLALTDLFNFRVEGRTEDECIKLAIESYVLTLLSTDMIYGAMEIHKYSGKIPNKYVDTIYMRRRLERSIIPDILCIYDVSDKKEKLDWYGYVCDTADLMYAKFCEYAFSRDYTCTAQIIQGSDEWKYLYYEINRLLQLPV